MCSGNGVVDWNEECDPLDPLPDPACLCGEDCLCGDDGGEIQCDTDDDCSFLDGECVTGVCDNEACTTVVEPDCEESSPDDDSDGEDEYDDEEYDYGEDEDGDEDGDEGEGEDEDGDGDGYDEDGDLSAEELVEELLNDESLTGRGLTLNYDGARKFATFAKRNSVVRGFISYSAPTIGEPSAPASSGDHYLIIGKFENLGVSGSTCKLWMITESEFATISSGGVTETELDTYLREHYDERGNKNS